MSKQKDFTKFIQDEVGAGYPLRTILDNLDEDQILDSIKNYVKYKNKNKNMKRLKFETKQQLDFFVLNYLVQVNEVEIQEINEPLGFSVADLAEEISDFLVMHDLVKVYELEEFECPEGCTGCDEPKG